MTVLNINFLRQSMFVLCLTIAVGSGFFVFATMADENPSAVQQNEDHRQAIEAWRSNRHERLLRSDGWLTLVGLEWLKDGENRVGSAADNDIRLSGGPEYWGSVFLKGDKLRFVSHDTDNVMINGEPSPEIDLIADVDGDPTLVASDNLSFYTIFRESFALRVKDSQAPVLLSFKGLDNYPIDESWHITGRFVRAETGTVIEIANVLGQISESPVYGTIEFDMNGETHRLLGLGDAHSKSLWFIFADRTSGHGSYGAGRFLYSETMPENGHLIIDFNKAYNPPCAFNPYSTCPLPPQENRMDLLVTAGEKDFHPDSS
jgi:uncharacterized protein (DUF1684 family)